MKSKEFNEMFLNWIKILSKEELIPKDIKALNFGLFESENSYIVHLYGCESYKDKNDEWSYYEDYVPKRRFLEFNKSYINNMHWESFQCLIANSLRDIVLSNSSERYNIFAVEHVTTGFDDGDLIVIK